MDRMGIDTILFWSVIVVAPQLSWYVSLRWSWISPWTWNFVPTRSFFSMSTMISPEKPPKKHLFPFISNFARNSFHHVFSIHIPIGFLWFSPLFPGHFQWKPRYLDQFSARLILASSLAPRGFGRVGARWEYHRYIIGYPYIYIHVHICIIYIYISIYLSIYLSLSLYLYISISLYLYTYLSIYLSLSLSLPLPRP